MKTDFAAQPVPGRRAFTADQCVELAAQLLARYPGATLSAVGESGRFVPMPADVPLQGHELITGHDTALDLVVPADIVSVIEAWKAATTSGAGVADVHPLEDPDGRLAMYFVDTRARYGVLLGVAVTPDGALLATSHGTRNGLRPRLTVVRKNGLAEFVDVDDAFTRLLGYEPADIVGRRNLDLVHPDEHSCAIANWVDMLGSADAVRPVRLRHRHADGHWVWFEVTNHNRLLDPVEECVVTEMIDITDEMTAQEDLRANRQLLARLTETLPVGVLELDRDRNVVSANARAGEMLGRPDAGTLAALFAGVRTDDIPALDDACAAVLERGVDVDVEVGVRHSRHDELRCRLSLRPLTSGDTVTGAVVCVDVVTEPARSSTELDFRAGYDALTGCLDRASLLGGLDRAVADAARYATGTAVFSVELDGSKAVNGTRGPAAGDPLLQEMAGNLAAAARRGDLVGRVGGDEFVVVGCGVGTADQARAIAQRLADGLAASVAPQPDHRSAASIGAAWAPGNGPDAATADELIARADGAMYVARRAGDGRPVLG